MLRRFAELGDPGRARGHEPALLDHERVEVVVGEWDAARSAFAVDGTGSSARPRRLIHCASHRRGPQPLTPWLAVLGCRRARRAPDRAAARSRGAVPPLPSCAPSRCAVARCARRAGPSIATAATIDGEGGDAGAPERADSRWARTWRDGSGRSAHLRGSAIAPPVTSAALGVRGTEASAPVSSGATGRIAGGRQLST